MSVQLSIKIAPPSLKSFLSVATAKRLGYNIVKKTGDNGEVSFESHDFSRKFEVWEDEQRGSTLQIYVNRKEIPEALPMWIVEILGEYAEYLESWIDNSTDVPVTVVYFLT